MDNATDNIQFHDDIAVADTAFTVKGKDENELFKNAAIALISSMAKIEKIEPKISREFRLHSERLDLLLFDFLDEILFYKDTDQLLFSNFTVSISKVNDLYELEAVISGEHAEPKRHEISIDVKAITMHMFEVKKTKDGFEARVVIDI